MTIDLFDLPGGMDGRSIVTVTVAELRRLYAAGRDRGEGEDESAALVEVAACPWLGDLGRGGSR